MQDLPNQKSLRFDNWSLFIDIWSLRRARRCCAPACPDVSFYRREEDSCEMANKIAATKLHGP